jgi:uncharacterized Tic20 family protein
MRDGKGLIGFTFFLDLLLPVIHGLVGPVVISLLAQQSPKLLNSPLDYLLALLCL